MTKKKVVLQGTEVREAIIKASLSGKYKDFDDFSEHMRTQDVILLLKSPFQALQIWAGADKY